MLTRIQFIAQMILALGEKYPDADAKTLMPMASAMYRDFVEEDKIDYGDPRYDWSASGARALVKDMDY